MIQAVEHGLERKKMRARILDQQVKVYSGMDANAVSLTTLREGTEIEFGGAKRKDGKLWVPITLSTGQQAYIPGETKIFVIQQGSLLQNNVDLRSEPSSGSLIKQQLARNTKLYILQVVKGDGQDWVKVRDMSGSEGYINGNTRLRMNTQKTKALGRKNMLSGAMWLIAGGLITFSGSSPASSGFYLLGFGAMAYGLIMLVWGIMQMVTAPA
jgi:uncharacterized protein YgiM (DUF1202 family)